MHILVIDDTKINHASARQTLQNHDLTLVSTHDEAIEMLKRPPNHLPSLDAALIDLLMPAGSYEQGREGEKFVGEMMPVGFPLALFAARVPSIRYIGVVTATNHHHHPMAAAIDHLSSPYWVDNPKWCPAAFKINDATAGFFNAPFVGVEGIPCGKCNGLKQVKCENCTEGKKGDAVCAHCEGNTIHKCYSCTPRGTRLSTGLSQGKDWGKVLARLMGTG